MAEKQNEAAAPPFAAMRPDAENHFRLLCHAAVFHLCHYLRNLATLAGEPPEAGVRAYPFLVDYFDSLRAHLPDNAGWDEARDWWRGAITEWEAKAPARLPLLALSQHADLTYMDRLALALAGLVEEDIRFGAVYGALQDPLPSRRPCLGLLEALLAPANSPSAGEIPDCGLEKLRASGAVLLENGDAPRAEWIVRVPTPIWDALRGSPAATQGRNLRWHPRRDFPALKRLALSPSLREQMRRVPALMARSGGACLILRGMANSGRKTVFGSLARALRRDLWVYDGRAGDFLDADWNLLGPLCALTGALPFVRLDPAPGATATLPRLSGYRGPLGIALRREGGVTGEAAQRAVTLTLPLPRVSERAQVWRQTLGERAAEVTGDLAERFLLPLGNVHRAAQMACAYAELEQRAAVTQEDAQRACRALNRQALDTLAQRLEVSGGWQEVIVNPATAADLMDLERRCRHREALSRESGADFGAASNRGVRALFNGPSGTGKTLAARILASVLQMDLYRVDLASVVNKFVGETEKNLSLLLARAEELDIALLIDEGDALMTGRTEVKSANDRYANMETNYLLQRLESYEGIVLVTTNAGNRIDNAFQRRFDSVIGFQPPDASERLAIWRLHLPPDNLVSESGLRDAAQRCALTGGQIRNAALQTRLLALDGGRGGKADDRDLTQAVQREYRKAGASCPLLAPALAAPLPGGLSEFLAEIR